MKAINTRYGATVDLNVEIEDTDATSASIFVGHEGETPTLTKTASIVGGIADLSLTPVQTRIPLGTYLYQINVTYADGRVKKFPEPHLDADFPEFIVSEALDETEVTP